VAKFNRSKDAPEGPLTFTLGAREPIKLSANAKVLEVNDPDVYESLLRHPWLEGTKDTSVEPTPAFAGTGETEGGDQ
jgi:hypothetical protein